MCLPLAGTNNCAWAVQAGTQDEGLGRPEPGASHAGYRSLHSCVGTGYGGHSKFMVHLPLGLSPW